MVGEVSPARDKLGSVAQVRAKYHTQHCRVVNYLLDVNKGKAPSRQKRDEAFYIATWTANFAYHDENPPLHPDVKLHKTGRVFHVALREVAARLDTAQATLKPMLEWLERKLEFPEGRERFGSSYTYYTGRRTQLRRWREQLDDWDRQVLPNFEIPLETLRQLARHIRMLVLVQDMPRIRFEQARIASEGGAEAQTLNVLREAGWDHIPAAFSHDGLVAINAIRDYLWDNDDTLSIGGQPPDICRLKPHGRHEEPFFKAYLLPIVEVLLEAQHPVRLGVCEVCESIYVRNRPGHEHDTGSRVCDGNCGGLRRRRQGPN